jgi:hypothetical protein
MVTGAMAMEDMEAMATQLTEATEGTVAITEKDMEVKIVLINKKTLEKEMMIS